MMEPGRPEVRSAGGTISIDIFILEFIFLLSIKKTLDGNLFSSCQRKIFVHVMIITQENSIFFFVTFLNNTTVKILSSYEFILQSFSVQQMNWRVATFSQRNQLRLNLSRNRSF